MNTDKPTLDQVITYLTHRLDGMTMPGAVRMTTAARDYLVELQAENEKLREKIEDARLEGYAKGLEEMSAELEQVKRENNALWTYIEIVDREYRRYMDRGYIDRLDELKKVWKHGQKED